MTRRAKAPGQHLATLASLALAFLALALFALGLAPTALAAPRDAGGPDGSAIEAGAIDAAHDGNEDAQTEVDAEATAITPAGSASAATSVASAEPSAAPSASAAPKPTEAPREIPEGAPVRLHDRRVFSVRAARAGLTQEERARRATNALERAFDESESDDVRVDESKPGIAVVLVGNRPIIELTQEDADAAGDASLGAHAAGVGENVRSALKTERTRRDVSKRVFSLSLVVLSALVLFLLLRWSRNFAERIRKWVTDHPKRLPHLRIGSVEVMRPAAFQGLIRIGISLLERAAQLTSIYIWLIFVLSQFESTREFGGRITGMILTPLGALVSRIAVSLPLVVVAIVAAVVVFIVVRFIRLFFASVEVGETRLAWLPPDLAAATSAVLRLGVVIGALVVGAPLVTGTDQNTASRAGFVVIGALGLALVPILSSMTIGFSTVFWRRFHVGDFVSFDGRQGRVSSLTLFDIRVLDGEGAELRIPHLVTLVRPIRVLGAFPLATFEVVVDASAPQDKVRKVMATSGASKHGEPRVRLLAIDADGARYEIVAKRALDEEDPATAITRALADAGIALGRSGK